jgi:phytanoyl-CoA dioxygenase PhyH
MGIIERYARDGFVFPLNGLEQEEAARLMRSVQELESLRPGWLFAKKTKKPYLVLEWLNRLIRDGRILNEVEQIIGPNILCWAGSFFAKRARDPGMVTWHQDSTYWGLSSPDVVTAWVALTPSTRRNGCMRVIPGTHTSDQLPHRDTFAENNLLMRGQEIAVEVDAAKAVDIELQPGQFSLHHVRLVHGSEPNPSDEPRIGFAIRYLPTYVKQMSGNRDSATLVRGVDRFGNFELEPAPEYDFAPAAMEGWERLMDLNRQILLPKSQ